MAIKIKSSAQFTAIFQSIQEKDRIESLRKQVQSALDSKDDHTLQNACDQLTEALQAVGRYVDNGAFNSDDGTIDADYTTNDN